MGKIKKYFTDICRYIMSHKSEALYIWILVVSIIPNIVLSVVEPMEPMARIANVLFPLGLLWLLMNCTRRIGVLVLSLFPLMFFDAFQLVLLCIYGRSIIGIDMLLNMVTTNTSEAWELLSHILIELTIVILIYMMPLVLAFTAIYGKWRISSKFRRSSFNTCKYVCTAGILSFVGSCLFCKAYTPSRELFPYNVGCNIVSAVQRGEAVFNYPKTSADFRFNATDTDTLNVRTVIVVIGETSRADNWSMFGYERPTTEALDTLRGIYPFMRTMSESNTTHKSVPIMLTHLDATNFGDSVYYVKSLPALFKEAGWDTHFISNQMRNHALIDMMAAQADDCKFIKDDEGIESLDEALLPYLREALKSNAKNKLVILHTYGSHFSYEKRYRNSQAMFSNATTNPSSAKNRTNLVKAYDNTIQYTSRLLHSIIQEATRNGGDAIVVYTSDHGEDLYDDDRNLFLHSSPLSSYYQLHVPFFVWLSPTYEAHHPEKVEALRINKGKRVSSSASLFPTVVSLSGIVTPYLEDIKSLASPSYRDVDRLYINDYNESVNLEKAGFEEPDFLMLKKLDAE